MQLQFSKFSEFFIYAATVLVGDCFFNMGRQRVYLAVQTVERSASEETKKQRKRQKAKADSKELEEYSLVKNKHRTLYGGQKKIVLGGPKVREATKVSRKVMEACQKDGLFALINQKRVQAMISHRAETEVRTKKEMVR